MRQSERLWHLVRSYGMGECFMAAWVEGLEEWAAARRLGVSVPDVDDAVACTWADVLRGCPTDGDTGVIWAGRLTADWTQIIQVRGYECDRALRDLSYGGRALLVGWDLNGPRDLEYAVNGEYVTGFNVTAPGKHWGSDPQALNPYARGLQFDLDDSGWESDPGLPPGWLEYCAWEKTRMESGKDYGEEAIPGEWQDFIELSQAYSPPMATCLTSALTLVGRVTGREIDTEWMDGAHTCYVIRDERIG
jgi:allantoicase